MTTFWIIKQAEFLKINKLVKVVSNKKIKAFVKHLTFFISKLILVVLIRNFLIALFFAKKRNILNKFKAFFNIFLEYQALVILKLY